MLLRILLGLSVAFLGLSDAHQSQVKFQQMIQSNPAAMGLK